MRDALAAVITVLAVAAPAVAQDWSGFYLGGHVGAADLSGDYVAFTPRNGFAGFPISGLDGRDAIAGIHAGYHWDLGDTVAGIEITATGGGVDQSSTTSPTEGTVFPFTREMGPSFSLTPKIGAKAGHMLVYARGGVAVTRIENSHLTGAGTFRVDETETRTGWIIGLGVEGPLKDNLMWRAELTHADYGDFRIDMRGGPNPDIWVNQEAVVQTLTVGITYYFD